MRNTLRKRVKTFHGCYVVLMASYFLNIFAYGSSFFQTVLFERQRCQLIRNINVKQIGIRKKAEVKYDDNK